VQEVNYSISSIDGSERIQESIEMRRASIHFGRGGKGSESPRRQHQQGRLSPSPWGQGVESRRMRLGRGHCPRALVPAVKHRGTLSNGGDRSREVDRLVGPRVRIEASGQIVAACNIPARQRVKGDSRSPRSTGSSEGSKQW
jgi:hypothetical protein